MTYLMAGQPEEAIRSFERGIRLSPFDPLLFSTFAGMGVAFIGLGRFDEAIFVGEEGPPTRTRFIPSLIAALRQRWLI